MNTETKLKKCPHCSKFLLNPNVAICKHCGANLGGENSSSSTNVNSAVKNAIPPKIYAKAAPPPVITYRKKSVNRKLFVIMLAMMLLVLILAVFNLFYEPAGKQGQTPTVVPSASSADTSNAVKTSVAPPAAGNAAKPQTEVLAKMAAPKTIGGPLADTPEITDHSVLNALSEKISSFWFGINSITPPSATSSNSPVFGMTASVSFIKGHEAEPLRFKIYRIGAGSNNSTLIYNEIVKGQHLQGATANLILKFSDKDALKSGSNKVYYLVRFCSVSGAVLVESKPIAVYLAPSATWSKDNPAGWTWSPYFPNKEPVDGALCAFNERIPVKTNAAVSGQLKSLPKVKGAYPPVIFEQSMVNSSWRYDSKGSRPNYVKSAGGGTSASQAINSSVSDDAGVYPVFNKSRYFSLNDDVVPNVLKIDGVAVPFQVESSKKTVRVNGVIKELNLRNIMLHHPGTPVAELEFTHNGKPQKIAVNLPPVPTGLRCQTQPDGTIKITWDYLAERVDLALYSAPPEISILRKTALEEGYQKIYTGDEEATEYIDRSVKPGVVYNYSIVLNGGIKSSQWSKENGVIAKETLIRDLANPFPDFSAATAYISPVKAKELPVRVSFWEPDFCYERVAEPGMALFSGALQMLGQEENFEILDRISRKKITNEKVMTMSYEKSTMIKSYPADFTVILRDYSRQDGNGVELWLVQNKTFEYYGNPANPKSASTNYAYAPNMRNAWRIGSIPAGSNQTRELSGEIAAALVEKIKQLVGRKTSPSQKLPNPPTKFVFNNPVALRQSKMVVDDKNIGETLMLQLSEALPPESVMTRDNWRTIFSEQLLLREQGEDLNNDLSGMVSISGWVWQEKDVKQYLFTFTDIKNGVCLGSVRCSGAIEEVAAKLANSCKNIKLVNAQNSGSKEQAKIEMDYEMRLRSIADNRYALKTFTKPDYLEQQISHQESSAEYAEKQWQLGNRDHAIKTLEEIFKKDKRVWAQLNRYLCGVGNYARALQLVELMMEQPDANESFTNEYHRIRAKITANAKPEFEPGDAKPELAKGEETAKPKTKPTRVSGLQGLPGLPGHQGLPEKEYINENFDKEYLQRIGKIGHEWNPGGQPRSLIKLSFARKLCFDEWSRRGTVQPEGVELNIIGSSRNTARCDILWESRPIFGNDESMGASAFVNAVQGYGKHHYFNNDCSGEYETSQRTGISLIKAFLAFVKNPDIKLVSIEEAITDEDLRNLEKAGIYLNDKQGVENSRILAKVASFGDFMNFCYKNLKKDNDIKIKDLSLLSLIGIYCTAKMDNQDAMELLSEIEAVSVPAKYSRSEHLNNDRACTDSILTFKAFRGNRAAIDYILAALRDNMWCFDSRGQDNMIYYLMAKGGRTDILAAMLQHNGNKSSDSVEEIRHSDSKILKKLLENPELFPSDLYRYLVEGVADENFYHELFRSVLSRKESEDLNAMFSTLFGKPVSAEYRTMNLNYKRKK